MTDSAASPSQVGPRRDDCAKRWHVDVDESFETESSVISFGRCGDLPVVLKVVKRPGDEWKSGDIVRAFGGRGMVRALEHEDGAAWLERLRPGTALTGLVVQGKDDDATSILVDVIREMTPDTPPAWCPTVADWGRAFMQYRERGETQIASGLVDHAERIYLELAATQRTSRLLHGDLQHYNVLHDDDRGWVAIDPKGVVGELEYELGASIRNPAELPALFTNPAVVRRRLDQSCAALGLDADRALAWSYAQAVLSAVWGVEDGYRVDASTPVIVLANTLRPLL